MSEKKKPVPIDIENIDLNKMKEKTTDLPGLIEYAHSIGGFQIVPTSEGIIKGQSLKVMHEQAQMQIDQIKEQMKLLATQAQAIKDRVEVSEKIYQAKISFEPVIGQQYYLYLKNSENWLLSMIGPSEWGRTKNKLNYIATVELLADKTWKIIQKSDQFEL